jgi:hypothetical protein
VIAILEQQVILVSSIAVHQLIQDGHDVVVETDRRVRCVPRISMPLLVFEELLYRNLAKIDGVLEGEALMTPRRDRVDTCCLHRGIAAKCVFGAVNFNTCMVDTEAYKICTSRIACFLNVVYVYFDLH